MLRRAWPVNAPDSSVCRHDCWCFSPWSSLELDRCTASGLWLFDSGELDAALGVSLQGVTTTWTDNFDQRGMCPRCNNQLAATWLGFQSNSEVAEQQCEELLPFPHCGAQLLDSRTLLFKDAAAVRQPPVTVLHHMS